MRSVGIFDYGCGNLASLQASFHQLRYPTRIITNHNVNILDYDLLVLPGVGSFSSGIKELRSRKYDQLIHEHLQRGGKLLGICLGFQLLFTQGFEGGKSSGLDLIQGVCVPFKELDHFDSSTPTPHVGFSSVNLSSLALPNLVEPFDFYFVHSFCIKPSPDLLKNCSIVLSEYGNSSFVSAVRSGNIFGLQFHPEKSQANGHKLLSSILKS